MRNPFKFFKKAAFIKAMVLSGYLVCVFVLIFESCMNGTNSASHSNEVGGNIAGIVNNFVGDQTELVSTSKIEITNKITEAQVGDSYRLKVQISPSNATYQGLVYSSNRPQRATVDANGLVTFLASGTVKISAASSKYTDISDTMTIEVREVEATRIEASIAGIEPDDDGIYNLVVNQTYAVTTTFYPGNTSVRKLDYSLDSEEYLKVTEDGRLIPIKHSFLEITTLTVKNGNVTTTLRIRTALANIVEPVAIEVESEQIELYATQSVALKYAYQPSETTFQTTSFTIEDTGIATVKGATVKGVKPGQTKLTIASKIYPEIFKTIAVKVLSQPDLTDYTPVLTKEILVGNSAVISLTKVTPSYASVTGATYDSSDESVAKVDSVGKVTGIAPGTATITVVINQIRRELTVAIKPNAVPETDRIESFTLVSPTFDDEPYVLCDQEYDLDTYFSVFSWQPKEPTDKDLTYELVNKTRGNIKGTVLTMTTPGSFTLTVTHEASQVSVTYNLTAVAPFTLDYLSEDFQNFTVGDINTIKISESTNKVNPSYLARVLKGDEVVIVNGQDKKLTVTAVQAGDCELAVLPVINGTAVSSLAQTISFTVAHRYTRKLNIRIFNEEETEIELSDRTLTLKVGDRYKLSASVDSTATLAATTFESANENVIKVQTSGLMKAIGAGTTEVTVKEKLSGLTESFTVKVYNIIGLEHGCYSLNGKDVTYEEEIDTYVVTNGFPVKISPLFSDQTTYTDVSYKSSDEKILTVAADGTITPIKVGTAEVTLVIDDTMLEPIELTIRMQVKKQSLISDMNSFLRIVRKALGHFGAFLVLGIFSTLVSILFFRRKGYFFSLPLNFASGFLIAGLTEFIQTFIPGRSGLFSDVLIDFIGFSLSSFAITAGFLIGLALKHRRAAKKAANTNEKE